MNFSQSSEHIGEHRDVGGPGAVGIGRPEPAWSREKLVCGTISPSATDGRPAPSTSTSSGELREMFFS
ncbi:MULTISPECIES: hypothetical protein [Pseudonocardia]|uniref:hypothetical protein n=1 Tax=Pseudonocardia TaxID=1847 RepID=UPI000304ACD1|nr:hypothetical protein [Pseudonocardia dioxanivorans]